jgi:hypothetical protein
MAREEFDINEDSNGKLTFTLKDETETVVPSADIGSIVCTMVELGGAAAVNSRTNQNVFNANNCTFHATSGLFTWNVQILDTDIINTSIAIGQTEKHLATFTFTWSSGTKAFHQEILLNVLNLRSVPHA